MWWAQKCGWGSIRQDCRCRSGCSAEIARCGDAWLLEQDATREAKSAGYAVGRLNAEGQGELWSSCIRITADGPGDSKQDLMGVLVESSRPGTGALYGFAALLALLSLPAITAVSLGEYSANPQKTSWGRKLYRWSFLAAKVALLTPMVYFAALDLAYGFTSFGRDHAIEIQLAASFSMCLFGMRWVLKDQRRRCPVCLRCVAHPAQVGQASRTFLAWNGTEMMCMGGHTLLHVPSLPQVGLAVNVGFTSTLRGRSSSLPRQPPWIMKQSGDFSALEPLRTVFIRLYRLRVRRVPASSGTSATRQSTSCNDSARSFILQTGEFASSSCTSSGICWLPSQ